MEEFEIKFLEVDVPELEKKLLAIGAKKVDEYNYRRVLMDYPDLRMNKKEALLRLRTDGTETTLTYKERIGVKSNDGSIADEGMKEIETKVESYEDTYKILLAVGLVVKIEQKNRRVRYEKGDGVFDIDFWPGIPPYIEIESVSLEKAKTFAAELGFNPEKALICSAKEVLRRYGFVLDDYSYFGFDKMIKK